MRKHQLFGLALVAAVCMSGQSVISARSGMMHYTEGRVVLGGKAVEPKFGEFPQVKNGVILATEDGRAEVLLTPGVFLRLSESSSFRMVSDSLNATRIELVSGSALLEVDELLEGNAVTVLNGDAQIAVVRKGLYRVDAEPARLRVYDGEARVVSGSDKAVAKKGREVGLGAVLAASNFNTKDTDAFYRWSLRRAEYIATANIASARSSFNRYSQSGNWVWNPYFGMFTYLPGLGYGYSPYGFYWQSPVTVYMVQAPVVHGPTQIPSPIRAQVPSSGSSSVGMTVRPSVGGLSPAVVNAGGITEARGGFGGYSGGGYSGGGAGVSAPSAGSMGSSGGATASRGGSAGRASE